jgi:ubiquinone/menaquinone biosynthesis C-methylase UbiE
MANVPGPSVWQGADAYEAYMGRWSRPMAQAFLAWFAVSNAGNWLDVGCGTGALTAAVLDAANPITVVGVDPSTEFLGTAQALVSDPRTRFEVGDACALPVATGGFDAVVAGLVLNHVPDPAPAVAELVRAARAGGAVGAYVWDYSGEMQLMRYFWDAVAATDPDAATHDPRAHYHICQPDPLAAQFRTAGLKDVEVDAIDLPMRFRDLDDFWRPHTMTGPAAVQRYVSALDDERRAALRERLRIMLPIAADGTIDLNGRAWAVRGTK